MLQEDVAEGAAGDEVLVEVLVGVRVELVVPVYTVEEEVGVGEVVEAAVGVLTAVDAVVVVVEGEGVGL